MKFAASERRFPSIASSQVNNLGRTMMTKPRVRIRFDAKTKQYTAEEMIDGGLYGAFGATPEEAMAGLELMKSITSDCELCRAELMSAGSPKHGPHDH